MDITYSAHSKVVDNRSSIAGLNTSVLDLGVTSVVRHGSQLKLGFDSHSHWQGSVTRNITKSRSRGLFLGKLVALKVVTDHSGLDKLTARNVQFCETRESWGHDRCDNLDEMLRKKNQE